MKKTLLLSLAAVALVLSLGIPAALAFTGMEVASVSSGNVRGNGSSEFARTSADGRYVTFRSNSTNLVSPATSGWQIFVRDRLAGTTTLVSAGASGGCGNADSWNPNISGDGRYIAFSTDATNLVSPASSGVQVFVRDWQAGATTVASVSSAGAQGNGDSLDPSISYDGRYVAFFSTSTNLVSPATSGQQVFVRDRQAGVTTLVSVNAAGIQGNGTYSCPSINADGRFVAFQSNATNLVSPATSGSQIFIRDRLFSATTLASADATGAQGNGDSGFPCISADGLFIAFSSNASNLSYPTTSGCQVFVRDRQAGTITLASRNAAGAQGNSDSFNPSISADGRYVAFYSWSSNLVNPPTPGNWHVFVRDTQAGTTTLASATASGVPGNNGSYAPGISADGRYVAFFSRATNLVNPGTTGQQAFVTGSPYTLDTRVISASASANGSISPSGQVTVTVGANQVFTITANTGFQVADVLVDGASAGAVSAYTFTNVTANHTISASFARSLIGTRPGSSGTISAPPTPQNPVDLANLKVSSAKVSASRVGPGEFVTVTADVANKGTGNGSMTVKLYVNGQEEASQGITVNSGSSAPVTFTVSRSEPGTYTVCAGAVPAGSFTVESKADSNIILGISIAFTVLALAGLFMAFSRKRTA